MRRCLSEKEWSTDADCTGPADSLGSVLSGMGVILRWLVRPSGIRVLPDGAAWGASRWRAFGYACGIVRRQRSARQSVCLPGQASSAFKGACAGRPMVRLRNEQGPSGFRATIGIESDCQFMSYNGAATDTPKRSDHVEYIDATDRHPSILGTAAAVAGHHLFRHPLRWGGTGPAGRAGHHAAGLPVRRGARQAAHRCHPDHHCGGHDLGHAGSHRGAEPDRAAGREAVAPSS